MTFSELHLKATLAVPPWSALSGAPLGVAASDCTAADPRHFLPDRARGSIDHAGVGHAARLRSMGKAATVSDQRHLLIGPMKLDRIDLKILSELQKNGRITNVELAELVHLSPSPCLMRVKKLQSEGYITHYAAQIDVAKIGQTLTVFTEVTLRNHRQIDFARFLSAIEKVDNVTECHLVSGGYDYLVKFMTPDIAAYQAIMERLLDLDVGIDKYFSYVVLKSPIVRSFLPFGTMFPA